MTRNLEGPGKAPQSVGQALATSAGAFLANWLSSQLIGTAFIALGVVGLCTDEALSTCILLSSLIPATGVAASLSTIVLLLRGVGPLRSWRVAGIALAFVSFLAGAAWQGLAAAERAQRPLAVGVPESALSPFQPWLPALVCTATVLCWFALEWRRIHRAQQ